MPPGGGLWWWGGIGPPPVVELSANTETEATCGFVGPQQKSEWTDVDETGRVNPCHHKVCNEPLWKKGNLKCEKCDCKNSKYSRIPGG